MKRRTINLTVFFASTLGCGFFPFAPGTFTTLVVGVPLALLGLLWAPWVPLAALVLCVAGVPLASRAERALGQRDSGIITIDETAGFMVTMVAVPLEPLYIGLGFLLFRLFDVLKPPPVDKAQQLRRGWGVMLDDILAGIYANLLLQVLRLLLGDAGG